MADAVKLNRILGIAAAIILLTSFGALAYTFIPKGDADAIRINGTDFAWTEVFADYETLAFTAAEQDFEGVSLEELVLDSGVTDPASHTYRLIGIDGYQKDVAWNDIQNGYLVLDKHRAVFPKLTQSFWVRDLATIEVV
jgi:hypothetical protein